jgi:hypothetical protein
MQGVSTKPIGNGRLEAHGFLVCLAERERNLKSRMRSTASGGDRFAVVLEFKVLSRIIASKPSMKGWR